ncbi:MAG: CBS domain-containing protein [Tropheryma whipplei]|uniref:Mg2+ transporter n=2 Tax=Tropheryma whipplei TaxID=2039 RepID=Q83MT9_TROWT|nr:Mg2+ transporter [Tropheryma whipplei str. Twist]MCO8189982.1 CBS domain-containing protein [Tropheryma whipplei]
MDSTSIMSKSVYISRVCGSSVLGPTGDRLGKVKDVLGTPRLRKSPRIIGMVLEIVGKRYIFVSINRVTAIDNGYVATRGVINIQRFRRRSGEICLSQDIVGKKVSIGNNTTARAEDIEILADPAGEWYVGKIFVRTSGNRLFSRGNTCFMHWQDISGLDQVPDYISNPEIKAADLAADIVDMPSTDAARIVEDLPDERLADVLEEMEEPEQAKIIDALDDNRTADILEEMQPDDAVDLIGYMSNKRKEGLLQLMEPEEARKLRLLLGFAHNTAGGMMTSDFVIVSPDTTVAEALALIRRQEIAPALASTVCVALPPYDPPTGRFIGVVHFQALLRQPPYQKLSHIIDTSIEPVLPTIDAEKVSRILATYNLLSLPVIDDRKRLLGIITIDDVLDYVLPKNWRKNEIDSTNNKENMVHNEKE